MNNKVKASVVTGVLVVGATIGFVALPDAPIKTHTEIIMGLQGKIHEYKAEVLSRSMGGETFFVMEGIEVNILEIMRKNDLLSVEITARKDGQPLVVNNPYLFKNPPLKIATGTFRTEIIDGVETEVHNTEENPKEALKTILIQAVKLQNNL